MGWFIRSIIRVNFALGFVHTSDPLQRLACWDASQTIREAGDLSPIVQALIQDAKTSG